MKNLIYLFPFLILTSCGPSQEEFNAIKQEIHKLRQEIFYIKKDLKTVYFDSGGGIEGAKSSEVDEESISESSKQQVVQEESPIQTNTGTNNVEQESENISEDPEAKYELTTSFGGDGDGDGTDPAIGGGLGDGVGRQVIGNPALNNAYNWEGFVMVEFIIDRSGNVISTRVLYPHPKTSLTLSNSQKAFVEKDCKNIFKFTPNSSANKKDRVFKRMQYALK